MAWERGQQGLAVTRLGSWSGCILPGQARGRETGSPKSAMSALGFWLSGTWSQGVLEMLAFVSADPFMQGGVWRPLNSGDPGLPQVTHGLCSLPVRVCSIRRVCVVWSLPSRMTELVGCPS